MKIPQDAIRKIERPDGGELMDLMIRKEQFNNGNANVMHECLLKEIAIFEGALSDNETIGGYIASFGKQVFIQIESVGYRNPYLILFNGINLETGKKVTLAQHVTQMNVMFCAVAVEEGEKPRSPILRDGVGPR